jgi:hypothetical protein
MFCASASLQYKFMNDAAWHRCDLVAGVVSVVELKSLAPKPRRRVFGCASRTVLAQRYAKASSQTAASHSGSAARVIAELPANISDSHFRPPIILQ